MAAFKATCALALLAIVLATAGAEARRGHGGSSPRDYLVQGMSRYGDNRPRDPTPLAPTSAGPYVLAHRGSSGAASLSRACSARHSNIA